MSVAMVKQEPQALRLSLTPEQAELVRRQCMPQGSSDDEFALFMHVAQEKGLDPLQREIHCTKQGGKLQFIADINGLQKRASREPDYEGISQAVVYEKDEFLVDQRSGEILKHISNPFTNGRPVGAWAVVKRKGMLPFRSMVRFSEYDNPNNAIWRSKPSVMIEKVAKSVALRLAYPAQLGGVYERAELDRAEEKDVTPKGADAVRAALAKTPAKPFLPQEPKAELPAKTQAPVQEIDGDLAAKIMEAEAEVAKRPDSKIAKKKLEHLQGEMAKRRGRVIDVEPGQTEEEAEAMMEPPPVGDEDRPWGAT